MPKEMPKTYSLKVEFGENFENIGNSGFKKGTCKIAYAGKNRNLSNIPKEAFEKAKGSLALVPVVGNWIGSDKGGFGGHDVSIELKGNDVDFKPLTIAYGVVPENNNAEWVDVEDENGNIKKYYKTDIVFWYDRYPEQVQFIIDNKGVNQSMEIDVIDGKWDENYQYFGIDEFEYSALCLLGRDNDNPENTVEPCFENAEVTISQFALNEDEFKSNFTQMMQELKNAYAELEQQKEDTPPEEPKTEDFSNDADNIEKIIFELSHDDIRAIIWDKLNPVNEEGYRDWNYWILEVFDTYVIVQDENKPNDYYKVPYTKTDDDEIELGEFIKVYPMYLTEEEKTELETMRNEYAGLKELNSTLQTENAQLKSTNEELSSFKSQKLQEERENEENILFTKYDEILDSKDETYKSIKENKNKFSISELKKELALIFAEKQLNFSSNKNKDIIKLGGDKGNTGEVSPYGNLFEKHLINNKEEE